MLRGTIRDQVTQQRRPSLRFFACEEDLSHEPPDAPLPEAVASGKEPFIIIGAIAGGEGRSFAAVCIGTCRASLGLDSRGRLSLRNLGRARRPSPHKRVSSLLNRHKLPRIVPNPNLPRARDLLFRISQHFLPLR